jgi:hypothetical protein
MINTTGLTHPALDKITRITPTISLSIGGPRAADMRADYQALRGHGLVAAEAAAGNGLPSRPQPSRSPQ